MGSQLLQYFLIIIKFYRKLIFHFHYLLSEIEKSNFHLYQSEQLIVLFLIFVRYLFLIELLF